MSPVAIVPHFDVLKQGPFGHRASGPRHLLDEFGFERGKEAFGHGIIPAIAFPAKTARHPLCPQQGLIRGAGGSHGNPPPSNKGGDYIAHTHYSSYSY